LTLFTQISEVFAGLELKADWIFSPPKADSVCLNEKHTLTHAAMLTRKCLNLHSRPVDCAVCMTIARGLIQMTNERRIRTNQYEFLPDCSMLGSRMLKFDKDITNGKKKQHNASTLISDLSYHVFRLLAYFSNESASVLTSYSGSLVAHIGFFGLIPSGNARQHPKLKKSQD